MYCYLKSGVRNGSHKVEIPDGTKEIAGVIISGDEILVYPCFCDPEYATRIGDFFDGAFCRVWKDGKWVDKDDYMEIETEEG